LILGCGTGGPDKMFVGEGRAQGATCFFGDLTVHRLDPAGE
jgi:hypothetical protein